MNQLIFKRIGYAKVQVGNKILNRPDSIKVIRAFKHRWSQFQVGNEITVDFNNRLQCDLYKDLKEVA
ncbi:hypothetical protein SAMN05421676_11252 [Salinibacillus kushneri]|uniref:Uncharacterized protein n=1 Tax=Salinibacillus kushneri TaxID=237682 RepID=A0A1I0IHI3_9BACI|nr:hypothetical protein [Salinibacillus kushneri]SET95567.1 hypothetical protein SAMN05421676_11252 [Salinibacillus kushneri]